MIDFPYMRDQCRSTHTKIVMLVVDGLGGLPDPETRQSELEAAKLPNLDKLARMSACGMTDPVMPGITPGSGPGHMALFGYDPVKHLIGRGILEALGIGAELSEDDVAVRGNFCTIDSSDSVVDRRARRIPTEESAPLVQLLDQIKIPGVDISVYPVRDYRFVLVIRGEDLGPNISETDPQITGTPALEAVSLSPESEKTANVVNAFVKEAKKVLKDSKKANMVLLRGFSKLPQLPNFGSTYRLNPAAVAAYPMYRGLAQLVGMNVLMTGQTFDNELDTLKQHFSAHDFFFLHYKLADTAGEDGNFDAKVAMLEELDTKLPRLMELQPETLVIAGDHSTPSIMSSHSWHPVPLIVHSQLTIGMGVQSFSEKQCMSGSIGRIPAVNVMMLALSHAGKLVKFGP